MKGYKVNKCAFVLGLIHLVMQQYANLSFPK
jgi:hypothetical protein